MDFSLYTEGLSQILSFQVLFFILLGTVLGIVTGALPGLSAMMGVSILIPLTYSMPPAAGILMLIGVYLGANYAGAISATLVNIPGTPSAVMTTLDAYPLAKKGQAGKAIGIATMSSALGGLLSVITLVLIAPLVAQFALKFTSLEMFAVALFGLSIIAYVTQGTLVKGLIAGLIGLLIATIGADPVTATPRFTFGEINLFSGIQFISAMIGLYGVSEVILNSEKYFKQKKDAIVEIKVKVERAIPSFKDFKRLFGNISRSSVIGVIIGAIPGAGGTIASIVSYAVQKKVSKEPEKMGEGSVEGVASAEAANNSCTGGAMIPLLSLGIPGDAVTAILIGAFMIHGLVPGPMLFETNMDLVSAIFLGMVVANIFIMILGFSGAKYFAKLLLIPKPILSAAILSLCFIGTYAIQNNFFDVKVMLAFAVIGYAMHKADIPKAPLVLALILGPLMESNLRRWLSMADGDYWNTLMTAFSNNPISLIIFILTFITLCMPLLTKLFVSIRQSVSKGR